MNRRSALLPFVLSVACCMWGTPHRARGQQPPITATAFAPDGASLVAASQAGVQQFGWPKLERRSDFRVGASNLHCLAFSPDGRLLAVGGGEPSELGVLEVFRWPQGESVARFEGHADSVRSVAWLDDQHLVTASIDRQIKVWNLERKSCIRTLAGHSRGVNATCLIEGGKTLVTAGVDQSLRVWDVASGDLIHSRSQHTRPVHALARRPLATGPPMVASAAADRTIRFWQPTIGRMVRYVRLDAAPLSIAWTHDGERILAACDDGDVRVVDPINVRVVNTLDGVEGWAYSITAHRGDDGFVVAGSNGRLKRLEWPGE